MKYFFLIAVIAGLLNSCSNADKTPDVSNIKIELKLERFEKDFFFD